MAKRKRKGARPTEAKFYWANPPGRRVRGSVIRIIGGRTYEREVGPNDLLDIHETAAALGNFHVYSVYRLIWEDRLPVVRRGRNVLIRLKDMEAVPWDVLVDEAAHARAARRAGGEDADTPGEPR